MKDDAIKQARKIQTQLKDHQRELDEAKTGKEDLIAAAKEAEKKLKANEAEMAQVKPPSQCLLKRSTLFCSSWFASYKDCLFFDVLFVVFSLS